MKWFVLIIILLIQINFIYAICSEEQIDINTASQSELDNLYGIGSVKAQAIIDSRPFNSVDDLINVNGIGEKTLEGIKNQRLVCVDKEIIEKEIQKDIKDNSKDLKTDKNNSVIINESPVSEVELELEPIKLNLNPKDIKSEDDEKVNTGSYTIYSLFGFCILLALLFLLKKIKYKKYKNEFE